MYYGVYELCRQEFLTSSPGNSFPETHVIPRNGLLTSSHGEGRSVRPGRSVSPGATLAAGSVCGLISWTWCYPFDLVKSRIQAVPYSQEAVTPFLRTAKEIFKASGWRGFFVGYGVMATRSIPVNAMTFYGYQLRPILV